MPSPTHDAHADSDVLSLALQEVVSTHVVPPPEAAGSSGRLVDGVYPAERASADARPILMMQVAEPATQPVSAEPEGLPCLNGKQSRQLEVGGIARAAVKQPRRDGKQPLIEDTEGGEEGSKQQAARLGAGGQKNDLLMIVVRLITSLYN